MTYMTVIFDNNIDNTIISVIYYITVRIMLFSKETKQQLFELLNNFELRTRTSLNSSLNVFGTAGITGFATVYEECFTLTAIAGTWSI